MKKQIIAALIACMTISNAAFAVPAYASETKVLEIKPIESEPVEVKSFVSGNSSGTGKFVCKTTGEGIALRDDDTFVYYADWAKEKGKIIGTYEIAGDEAILYSPAYVERPRLSFKDGNYVFGNDVYEYDGLAIAPVAPAINWGVSITHAGDRWQILGMSMKTAAEEYKFSYDSGASTQMLEPGEWTTVEIKAKSDVATLYVINPYELKAPVEEGMVAGFTTEDKSFKIDDKYSCETECFDDALNTSVYSYNVDCLIYKRSYLGLGALTFGWNSYGDRILNGSSNCDQIMEFDGQKMTRFSLIDTKLLFDGLADSMEVDELFDMSEEDRQKAEDQKDSIVEELEKQFSSSDGSKMHVEDHSTNIDMDSNVLFAVDSYELSDEGKKYLDEFISKYAEVVFAEGNRDLVENICFEGHTDSSGEFAHNMVLSTKRADAVLEYCLSSTANGLSDEYRELLRANSKTEGFACNDLVFVDGKEDAAASRRVCVKIKFVNGSAE